MRSIESRSVEIALAHHTSITQHQLPQHHELLPVARVDPRALAVGARKCRAQRAATSHTAPPTDRQRFAPLPKDRWGLQPTRDHRRSGAAAPSTQQTPKTPRTYWSIHWRTHWFSPRNPRGRECSAPIYFKKSAAWKTHNTTILSNDPLFASYKRHISWP